MGMTVSILSLRSDLRRYDVHMHACTCLYVHVHVHACNLCMHMPVRTCICMCLPGLIKGVNPSVQRERFDLELLDLACLRLHAWSDIGL